jgi:polyisoprenoid-binding protein YceI
MKHFAVFATAAAVVSLVSCGPSAEEIAQQKEKERQDSITAAASAEHTYTVDVNASQVHWTGSALTYAHQGTVKFKSGTFTTQGPVLKSGEFVVDMTGDYMLSDSNYAEPGSKGGTKENLMGHLKSPDFFNVDTFPTTNLKITAVNGNSATVDLTVKGKTNSETLNDIVIIQNADGTVSASGKLTFDRKKYGLNWDYPPGEMVLKNEIALMVDLVGTPQ